MEITIIISFHILTECKFRDFADCSRFIAKDCYSPSILKQCCGFCQEQITTDIPGITIYNYRLFPQQLSMYTHFVCYLSCEFIVFNATFKKYFSYIVVVSFIDGGTWGPGENHRLVTSHWQTLSHSVVSSIPHH